MKIEKSVYSCFFAIAVTVFFLIFFHKVPVHHLWNGYETLAVSVELDENSVLNVLKNCGCESVVSLSLQNKTTGSPYSPVQKSNEFIDYNAKTKSFFFDKTDKYQIYYIPQKYSSAVDRAYRILIKNYNLPVYLDSQVKFPWTTPLLCVLFAIFLTFFSKYKINFFITAIFPVIFTFSQPFFAPSGAVCLLLFGFFAIQNIRRRNGFLSVMKKSFFTTAFFMLPVFFTFAVSFLSGILLFFSICSSFALEKLWFCLEEKHKDKLLFKSSLILPAKYITLANHFNLRIMAGCIFMTGFFLAQFSLSSRFLPSSSAKDLLIPAPARYNNSSIVSLSDYVELTWYTFTYPYRSLNSKIKRVEEGDTVVIPRFEKKSDGIVQTEEVVFRFDNDFRQNILKEIDSKGDNSMEKLLKKQGNFSSAAYSSSGTNSGTLHDLLILILEFLVTPAVLVYLLINSSKRQRV